MIYSEKVLKSHLYSVYFAPRGKSRMAMLGMQLAQQYLSSFDHLIGLVGESGAGKSMLIHGMFPGLEMTNDDEGVNIRPLPLLSAVEDDVGFYRPHTYHVDIRFEAAFTPLGTLAEAINDAVALGKRVIIEHYELIYPYLGRNADLLIGLGEEVIITRPTLFGPEPQDIANTVFKSILYKRRVHSAEDMCSFVLNEMGVTEPYTNADVRHGFLLSFANKVDFDIQKLEDTVNEMIQRDVIITFHDEHHIKIDGHVWRCSGSRTHVRSAKEIEKLTLAKELMLDPGTGRFLLVGLVGSQGQERIENLNKIELW